MAIKVKFNKARAQYLLQCLASGAPIEPETRAWTGNDMLALAGACFFGALSQGPASFWGRDIPEHLHAEYREAEEETFVNDLHAAVEFYGQLTLLVQDKTFDAGYESNVLSLVTQEGTVHNIVRTITGTKASRDSKDSSEVSDEDET